MTRKYHCHERHGAIVTLNDMTEPLLYCDLIGDLPALAAQRWGKRHAFTFEDMSWSYQDAEHEVEQLARTLQALGVKKGDRVALWLTNSAMLECLLFAVIRIGAVAVPLNTRYRTQDLAYTLKNSGSVLLISAGKSGPVNFDAILLEALGQMSVDAQGLLSSDAVPSLRQIVMMGDSAIPGAMSWEHFIGLAVLGSLSLLDQSKTSNRSNTSSTSNQRSHEDSRGQQFAAVKPKPTDTALIVYTSGTTGNPKGVLLSHNGMRLCFDRAEAMQLQASDIQLTYLPLFHVYAISYSMIMSFMCGGAQVIMNGFQVDQALELIAKHRVTVVHGFDAHFNDFMLALAKKPSDISSLRFGTLTVGADSTIELAQAAQSKVCPTLSGYGVTELWGGVTLTPQDANLEQRCAASGYPLPGVELRVINPDTQQPVATGEVGEIQVRSYSRMIGYHSQPEATEQVFDSQGWYKSGDAGILRADGHVRFVVRLKDMLKVGGENVSPAEIEGLIATLPGVEYVAVVGRPDARLSEVPVAFIVSAATGPKQSQQVIAHCKGKIASFKIPVECCFVEALPMTPTGKIQKEVLRTRLRAMLSNQNEG
jgi:fatty-acyl-CoA synthase